MKGSPEKWKVFTCSPNDDKIFSTDSTLSPCQRSSYAMWIIACIGNEKLKFYNSNWARDHFIFDYQKLENCIFYFSYEIVEVVEGFQNVWPTSSKTARSEKFLHGLQVIDRVLFECDSCRLTTNRLSQPATVCCCWEIVRLNGFLSSLWWRNIKSNWKEFRCWLTRRPVETNDQTNLLLTFSLLSSVV